MSRVDSRFRRPVTGFMDLRNRPRRSHSQHRSNRVTDTVVAGGPRPSASGSLPSLSRSLPPSVARVADRTRLSAELLAAILDVQERTRVSLDDIELADALADRLLARRRDRLRLAAST
ncbi:hypothetical protein FDG2_3715 [Candidatus Protofrankia californiensis]|uniref:Uncharacterized protein n=2 Tax=Protofrankia TaxID=2994361 RepID=A0A1C3P0D9_9ACTN|nr:hypothetical protein FDG2_3715 [Candidatus Protofrankia californiensis]